IKAYGTIEETRFPPRPEVSIENEQAVALIDATIFGSAKEGIMFGSESGIYYNSGSVKGHVPYSELAITPEDKIFKGKDGAVVVGVSVLKCLDEAEADRLLKALLELRSKLRDAAGLNDD
ncbi:MAG: hypothetical protein HN996_01310, partial [Opitutae bacterium]|nr:hypothetical protein [Opitutae bacterium]